jgi:hypothetical protein
VLLLADLAIRLTDLPVMYTDDGMFSRAEICRRYTSVWNWSFHFGGGSAAFQTLLFGLAAGLAAALLVGFETRLASIGCWVLLLSLHHRAPPVLSGAEVLLRMLLFWGMFLPLGRTWSLDSRRAAPPGIGSPGPVLSVASAALLLQMGQMYLFTAIAKSNPVWLRGEALAGVMAHDFYAAPLGSWLLAHPGLLAALTWGTLALEWAAPLLLFCPWRTPQLRLAAVAALAVMHGGIAVVLHVGLFSPVAWVGLLPFLPAAFWEHRWLARFHRPGPAADHPGHADGAGRPMPARVANLACGLALAYVLAVNLNGLPSRPLAGLSPENWKPLAVGTGLGQKWNMFEDVPSRDGWYVAQARLRDGTEVDLLRAGAPAVWQRPEHPAGVYPNHLWRKLFREMAYDDAFGYQVFRAPVASFLCRRWNARHGPARQVAAFNLVYCMEDGTHAPASSIRRIRRESLVQLDF